MRSFWILWLLAAASVAAAFRSGGWAGAPFESWPAWAYWGPVAVGVTGFAGVVGQFTAWRLRRGCHSSLMGDGGVSSLDGGIGLGGGGCDGGAG